MTYTPFPVWPAPEGGEGGGVTSHGALTGRSSADQHPIDAITGLDAALASAGGGISRATYVVTGDVTVSTFAALLESQAPAGAGVILGVTALVSNADGESPTFYMKGTVTGGDPGLYEFDGVDTLTFVRSLVDDDLVATGYVVDDALSVVSQLGPIGQAITVDFGGGPEVILGTTATRAAIVTYDNTDSGLTATNAQAAIDELVAGDTPPMFALYDPDDDIDLDAASGPTNGAVLFYGRSDNAEDGVYDVTVDDGYARRTIQPTAVIAIQVIDSAFDPLHASTDVAILIPDSPGGDNGWGVWGWFERVTPTSRGNLNRVFNVTSFAGDVVLSVNDGNSFYGPLSSNVTSVTLNDAPDGYEVQVILEITQDSSPHTITWGSAWNWAGGVAPTMSTGSGAVDVIVARTRDGGATIHASVMGQAFA